MLGYARLGTQFQETACDAKWKEILEAHQTG